MTIEDALKHHLRNQDLDIKNDRVYYEEFKISPRFMDQKVTPDVLSFIAECITRLPGDMSTKFTVKDVWDLDHFDEQLQAVFNKPGAQVESARSEYDKFVAQPLKTLAYAGILGERREKRQNIYTIVNDELLTFVALKPYNAALFLYFYVQETLGQSGIFHEFERYRDGGQSPEEFYELKESFSKFIKSHSKINTQTEIGRIFPKVLNVLAVQWAVRGSEKGRVSEGRFAFADLMYNRTNFRDHNKKKEETRAQRLVQSAESTEFNISEMNSVMRLVKRRHRPQSELRDQFSSGEATQVHHIFSQSKHGELRAIPENLILLTPSQHYGKAHPSNNTKLTDPDYQIECLIAKTDSIEESLIKADGFYNRESLIHCINEGLGQNLDMALSLSALRLRLRSLQRTHHSRK